MKTILALYPNRRGTAFACVELPRELLDQGVINVGPLSFGREMRRLRKYVEFFQPDIVVMRDEGGAVLSPRVTELIREVQELANEKGVDFTQYSREQIRHVFEQFGASTKYEIAKKIIEWLPQLSDSEPRIRKAWQDEQYHMSIFDAVSLAVTHEYLGDK